jgi:hypothetical protein
VGEDGVDGLGGGNEGEDAHVGAAMRILAFLTNPEGVDATSTRAVTPEAEPRPRKHAAALP